MKKYLKFIVSAIIVALILLVGFQIIKKSEHRKVQKEAIQTIPEFSFENINKSALRKNMPTIFIHFNSTCEYCQYEAQELYKYKDSLQNCQIFMVSEEPKEKLEIFSKRYKISEMPNLKVLQGDFGKYFPKSSIPDIYIYDTQGNLKKRFRGETKIEAILKIIKSM